MISSARLASALVGLAVGASTAAAAAAAAATPTAFAYKGVQTPISTADWLIGATMAAAASSYPNMPTSWPDLDETKGPINNAALLAHPLVQDALAIVNATVPAALLNLPLSLPLDGEASTYYPSQAQATQECYYGGDTAYVSGSCTTPLAANLTQYAPYLTADLTNCPGVNVLGLTYDDAPSGPNQENVSTVDLLAELAKLNQTATFFVIGSNVAYNPAVLQSMYNAGHELAVHTWTHTALTTLTNEQIVAEIKYTEAIIYYLTGVRPRYARSPYGDTDNRVRAVIGAMGYQLVNWDSQRDTGDADYAAGTSIATIEAAVLALWKSWYTMSSQPGFIELEHSLSNVSNIVAIAALEDIIQAKANGTFHLTIQTVGQCQGVTSYVPLNYTLGSAAATNATTSSSSASSATSSATVAASSSAPSSGAAGTRPTTQAQAQDATSDATFASPKGMDGVGSLIAGAVVVIGAVAGI